MSVVWKYPLRAVELQEIRMPRGAKVLHVAAPRGEPHLWALVDSKAPMEDEPFVVLATGSEFDATELEHVGTFLLNDGVLVFHVFRRRKDVARG